MNRKTKEDQDRAAGGEHMRQVIHPDGTSATASVSVQKFPNGYQLWGYLRFKTGGKTVRCYIGKVSAETHDESLSIGWKMARDKRVLERSGWSWVVPTPDAGKAVQQKKAKASKRT